MNGVTIWQLIGINGAFFALYWLVMKAELRWLRRDVDELRATVFGGKKHASNLEN